MNTCDYCHKEVQRHIFCTHSHQVMFHRKHPKINEVQQLRKEVNRLLGERDKLNKALEYKLHIGIDEILEQVNEA